MNSEHSQQPQTTSPLSGSVMVIGGGISGMQSALDLANAGFKVYLVESSPAIGGKMAQLDKTFPTNDCSMCIVSPKLVEVGRHLNIELLTWSEVTGLTGEAGNFTATVSSHARYVDISKCTGCGACELACPVTQISYFPEELPEGEKKKGSREKRIIRGPGAPVPQKLHPWTFEVAADKCSKCGNCFRACLHGAVKWEKGGIASIIADKCTGCGACYTACPEKFSAVTIAAAPEMDKGLGAAIVARSVALKKEMAGGDERNCIRCGLCAMTCKKVMRIGALKMVAEGIEASLDTCQVCGACVSVCPVSFLAIDQVTNRTPQPLYNTFNEGLNLRHPVNILYPQAVPRVPVIDEASCVHLNTGACGICQSVCGPGAIDYGLKGSEREIRVGSIVFAPGFEVFDAKRRGEFGYGLYKNVVTSIEFERLLSASGPTSGTVQRPGDGRHPKKIAWIQCVGSRDHSCDRDYCSSVCCMYATKEAYIAREHDSAIEPTIFYIDMRSFGKNFDAYVERAKERNIRFVRAMVSRVFEDPQTGDLELRYVDDSGWRTTENFDMVVLSVGVQIAARTRDLATMLGIELDRYGFAVSQAFTPLASSRPGIYVSGVINGPKDIPETVIEASGAAQAASAGLALARGTEVTVEAMPEERVPEAGEELRIGVFVCHCGTNIASVVDVAAVAEYARTLPGVVYAGHPLYTCSQDSQESIRAIISEHRLNRLVVAACSPSTHEPLFMSTLRQAGINKYFFDMANIRDQCSWVHPNDPQLATEKSRRLVRMAVANATQAEPLAELEFDVNPGLLVIGGGVAGMTAAVEAARQGFNVYLVERQPTLGGQVVHLGRSWDGQDFSRYLLELQEQVENNDRIRVFLNSEVVEHSGFVGAFSTDIMTPTGALRTVAHGAIIVATGAEEARPDLHGLGTADHVMTQTDFEARLLADRGTAPGHVVMLQCAGSRATGPQAAYSEPDTGTPCDTSATAGGATDHLPYCSRVCCNQAVKNALHLKEINPAARIDILYRDMRTYGLGELQYQQARRLGINFIRFDPQDNPPEIEVADRRVRVEIRDPSIGRKVSLAPDLLVLSTGMKPRDTEELASMLRVPRNSNGFFIEAHAKLRPVDLPSEGLFMAGTVHAPKDVSETIAQAQAAVARAAILLSKKNLRLSGVVSRVDPTHCAVCLTCVRACPYNVPFINAEHTAEINPALCQGCGICVAECPAKAITLGRYQDVNLKAKIRSYAQAMPEAITVEESHDG